MARVLIPLAQGCEELEAVTLIDLLRRAGIEVITVSLSAEPVTCSRKTVLIADKNIDDVLEEDFDMIVMPGGLPGADHLQQDQRVQSLLKRFHKEGKYTAAICAAPKALASAGLLENRKATSYPGVLEAMKLPHTSLTENPVQIDGKLITSRGPGTAMDFALALIEQLAGKATRDEVEAKLQRP
jgi:4-methyl-5(b-hydroxyethyl)-thiazole monophosphate biosynthesis